jgi:hypothetical protein
MNDSNALKTKQNPWAWGLFLLLHLYVLMSMVVQFFNGNYMDVFLCILTLLLFQIPTFVNRQFKIIIPDPLQIVILLFIFSANILGELREFYIHYPIWDTLLHTVNGFLMAAIGLSMIDALNRSERISSQLTPLSLVTVAFCFSMTIGVLWEFFEFGMDWFFGTDMQKDYWIEQITSVSLHPEKRNIPVTVKIEEVMINGELWEGYLDIGLIDTMKDLIMNFVGALIYSVFGYGYLKSRDDRSFAKKFIPVVIQRKRQEDRNEETEEERGE